MQTTKSEALPPRPSHSPEPISARIVVIRLRDGFTWSVKNVGLNALKARIAKDCGVEIAQVREHFGFDIYSAKNVRTASL